MQTRPPTRAIADGRAGLSLGTRLFLLMAAVIGVAMLLAVLVTAIGASRISRRAVLRALESSQAAQSAVQEQRREHLRMMARGLARDPYVTAYAAEADGTVYASSILHLLEERRQEYDFGFAIVLDPQGRALARTDRPGTPAEDLAGAPLVATALQRGEAFGIWLENGALYDAVAVPLARETTLFGYFVVGFPIDDSQALEMKRLSGTDVVYLSTAATGATVVASTLDAGSQAQLLAALRPLRAAHGSWPGEARTGAPLELDLGGRDWIALVRPLQDEPSPGVAIALAPLQAELHAFRQVERLLVAAGVVALLLALVLSYGLSRRTLRPVRQLAAAAAAARQGDYDQRVEVTGHDEVADLARTFNTLLADLRENRDMQRYIEALSRTLPVPAATAHGASLPGSHPDGMSTDAAAIPAAFDSVPAPFFTAPLAAAGGAGHAVPGTGGGDPAPAPPAVGDRGARPAPPGTDDRDAERTPPGAGSAALRPGSVLAGRSEILSLLGAGGMGVVLKAHDRQLGAALEAAHAQGIIHRDIKPENLILHPNGNAKLMDFGLARPVVRLVPGQTQAGMVVGTPHYLAPEQLTGERVDQRADIYASGVLLYEVFTGKRPFSAEDPYEVLVQHLKETPTPPRVHWPEIPAALERLLLCCLERAPEQRFADATVMLRALEALRDESRPHDA